MIIDKKTLSVLVRKDRPNEIWQNGEYYLVDDSSALGRKIIKNLPNVKFIILDDNIVDVEVLSATQRLYSHDEINSMIVDKIRIKYNVNEELKLINLGILNPQNTDYVSYRNYVSECILWGDEIEKEQGEEND